MRLKVLNGDDPPVPLQDNDFQCFMECYNQWEYQHRFLQDRLGARSKLLIDLSDEGIVDIGSVEELDNLS